MRRPRCGGLQQAGDHPRRHASHLSLQLGDREPRQVDVAINSTSYDDNTDYSDGAPALNNGDPCFKHTTADSISAPGYWTDVKVKERDLPSLFGGIGLPLSRNGARARVDIRPANSGTRFLPLAVPNNIITKVQVRYYNECQEHPAPHGRISSPGRTRPRTRRPAGGCSGESRAGTRLSATQQVLSPRAADLRPGLRCLRRRRHRGPGREPGRHRSESELRAPPGAQVRGLLPPALADPDLERRQRGQPAADHPGSSDRAAAAASADAYFCTLPVGATNCKYEGPSRSTGATGRFRR